MSHAIQMCIVLEQVSSAGKSALLAPAAIPRESDVTDVQLEGLARGVGQ